jgi:hypothetical protein
MERLNKILKNLNSNHHEGSIAPTMMRSVNRVWQVSRLYQQMNSSAGNANEINTAKELLVIEQKFNQEVEKHGGVSSKDVGREASQRYGRAR